MRIGGAVPDSVTANEEWLLNRRKVSGTWMELLMAALYGGLGHLSDVFDGELVGIKKLILIILI